MPMSERWIEYWMASAELTATLSKDPSTKVGAVIAHDKYLLGSGYNGFPANIPDNANWLADRPTKYKLVIHAEMNAILNAYKNGHHYEIPSATMFTTLAPCPECAKMIAAVGISKVYYKTPPKHLLDPNSEFQTLVHRGLEIFDIAQIEHEEI